MPIQRLVYKIVHVNQVIIELDDRMLERLNQVAPPKARKRSEFIREAIRRALDARLEERMEIAYRNHPQASTEDDVDPETWEGARFPKKRGTGR